MFITSHAFNRAKERLGMSRSTLMVYVSWARNRGKHVRSKSKRSGIRIRFQGIIFVFDDKTLITVW